MSKAGESYCTMCKNVRWIGVVLSLCIAAVILDYYFELHNHAKFLLLSNYDIYGYASIVDGDSIKINDEKIRLMHIDAPEIKQFCHTGPNMRWACGISSKLALEMMIAQRKVGCNRVKKGFYGRTLAVCYNHHGENINAQMIDIGMAIPYRKDKMYIGLADDAKQNKRGIHVSEFETPWDYRKNKRKRD